MSVQYKPVLWDRSKMVYDAVLIAAVGAYLLLYLKLAPSLADWSRDVDYNIQRMRAFGTCAFLMLSFILTIGPLARLNPAFLPLLYNRRHFGVLTCVVAAAHAVFVLDWYFAFSDTERYTALLAANTSYGQVLGVPFEAFGIAALGILIILAVTSHDFWMSFLTPPVWKAIHMSVYAAYALVVAHVAFGYLQSERSPVIAAIVIGAAGIVTLLHVAAARGEARIDLSNAAEAAEEEWVDVGPVCSFMEGRGRVVVLPDGERAAVFRHDGKLSALSNVCAHQNGPLGEGRIIDGCVTCPWHGHQFRPEDGCAPAPFTDKVPTYRLKQVGDRVHLNAEALAPGTYVEPIQLEEAS